MLIKGKTIVLFLLVISAITLALVWMPKDGDENLTFINDNFIFSLNKSGNLILEINDEKYFLNTRYSYPGKQITWLLPSIAESTEVFEKESNNSRIFEVSGVNDLFKLERKIIVNNDLISVIDRFTNTSINRIGLIYEHRLNYESLFSEVILSGRPTAESLVDYLKNTIKSFLSFFGLYEIKSIHSPTNQSVFIRQKDSSIFMIPDDTISKSKNNLKNNFIKKETLIENKNTFMPAGESITFESKLYLSNKGLDYFNFINLIRAQKALNSEISGPFNFFHIINNADLLDDDKALKEYLTRSGLKIVALTPWLDYDNYNKSSKSFITRKEYLRLFKNAKEKIRAADPSIRVLGCIQSNLVAVSSETRQKVMGNSLPIKSGVISHLTKEQSLILKAALPEWSEDDLIYSKDDLLVVEHSIYGDEEIPELSFATEPRLGGRQEKLISEQIYFLLNEVGLDGIYLDQFNQADISFLQRFTYNRDDRVSADIDPKTGQIIRTYTDLALSTIAFQEKIIDKFSNLDSLLVANTYPIDEYMNRPEIYRFGEGFWSMISTNFYNTKKRPRLSIDLAKGHFSSPIGLTISNWAYYVDERDRSRLIFRNIIYNLAHGNIPYFAHAYSDSAHGLINDMPSDVMQSIYPIEIQKIGNGWVKGKNKLITAVSKKITWTHKEKPSLLFFDDNGKFTQGTAILNKLESGYEVDIKISDWNELAILINKEK